MEKRKSAIEKVVIEGRSYDHEEFEPTFINFFFGRNGAGKSTISEMIQANTGLTWRSGQTVDDYNVLAYDQQFISDHFSNFDDLAGVFTLNKVNIETQKKLDQLAKDKDKLLGDLGKKNEAIDQKKEARDGLKTDSQTRMMRLTDSVRKKFDLAMTGKKIAKTFCPEVEKKQPVEHKEDEIMELYEVAYGKSAQTYPSLKKSNEYPGKYDLSGASYLGQPIVSTSDTQFARVMEKLGNTDWVKEGHTKYLKKADGICPFCHNPLDHQHFEQELKACFDEEYQDSVNAVASFQSAYTSMTEEMIRILEGNISSEFPRADFTIYKEKLKRLKTIIQNNLQLIQKKVEKPAEKVELQDIDTLIEEIDAIISDINIQIQVNNDAYSKKKETKIKCDKLLWEHLAFLVKDEIADFKTKDDAIAEEIKALEKEKGVLRQSHLDKDAEIKAESGNTVNTDEAFESMNAMLKDSGFQGFSLRKKPGVKNRYEVVRDGNKPVKRLSEGERNFIAFLYFYHLVKGSGAADAASITSTGEISDAMDRRDKIVVIDDPVTSMDSGTLFIVSSMVREMISVCHNNIEVLHPDITGTYIKQAFILTHNAYFHREVTYNMVEYYDCVTFYMVRKTDNHSSITPCIEYAKELSDDDKNVNPVQNAYTALWTEYQELQSSIPLLNVIRRILQYYFLELCGYQGGNIRDIILKKNKAEFITKRADGSIDDMDYHLASSMLSYIDNDYSFIDGFNLIQESVEPEQYKKVMKKIFDKLGQSQHYRMMTQEKD